MLFIEAQKRFTCSLCRQAYGDLISMLARKFNAANSEAGLN